MDWLRALYELVGVPFPRLSLFVAAVVGASLLGGAWWLVGRQYRKDVEKLPIETEVHRAPAVTASATAASAPSHAPIEDASVVPREGSRRRDASAQPPLLHSSVARAASSDAHARQTDHSSATGDTTSRSQPTPTPSTSQNPAGKANREQHATNEPDLARFPSQLASGWTISRKGQSWTVYFIVDTDQLQEFLRPKVQLGELPVQEVDPTLAVGLESLWSDVRRLVPSPDPPRIPIGEVAADIKEHISRRFEQTSIQWNYEYFRGTEKVKQSDAVPVQLSEIRDDTRQVISKLDRLASERVNRAYIKALQTLTP